MRNSLILMLLTVFQAFASDSYSQNTRLTMNMDNVSIQNVLDEIETQTEFYFLCNKKLVDVDRKVNLQVTETKIDEILASVFSETDVDYLVIDRQIVLSPAKYLAATKTKLQTITITGSVTDENGEPLPGVTIVVKGTATGSISDATGNYSIQDVPAGATLVFSFIGMQTQEIQVGNQIVIDVILLKETIGLDEVVVIGYGSRKKSDLTGAVGQINAEEITKVVAMSPQMAMQGKMAGVFVSNEGSSPNDRPTVRIRGVSTLGFNDPLYVIDGIPVSEGGIASTVPRDQDIVGDANMLNTINPNDIESITVLKDASATAIYGVRASNGVILITTKRGRAGKPKVELNASYGIQNIYKRHEGVSMDEYVDVMLEAWANNPNITPPADYYQFYDATSPEYLGNSQDYRADWEEAVFNKNAAVQNYNLSISGGNEGSNFAVGAGYSSQDDALFYSEFQRYSFFLNSDHKLNKYFKVGESFRFSYSETEESGGSGTSGPGMNVYNVAPWQPLYDANGLYGLAAPGRIIDGNLLSRGYGNGTKNNFLGVHEGTRQLRQLMRTLGSFYAEFSPLDGLRFRGTFSYDIYNNQRETYSDIMTGHFSALRGEPRDDGNYYNIRVNDNINLISEFLIGYNKSLGRHNVDIILNAMDQRLMWNLMFTGIRSGSPITSWEQRRVDQGWPAEDTGTGPYERRPSGLMGYMGRLSYNFDSRYYLDATIRRDGSSKFGEDYKWGTFPSVAAAWRLSSEKFMENVNWLNDLKIRAGWGKSGNQETKDFAFISLVNTLIRAGFGNDPEAVGSGILYLGSALGDFPILDMSWETITTSNVGFDAVLLNNRMTFTAEYYNRLTEGILQEIGIPMVVGALYQPVVNLATVENQGFEFLVGYNDRIGDLGYNVSLNLTTIKNRVSDLYNGKPAGGSYGRIEEGQSMNFLYGYITDGIFQTQAEVDDYLANLTDAGYTSLKGPGDVRYVDIAGPPTDEDPENAIRHEEPDGAINVYDQTYLGKTIPSYYYGLNIGLDYKNWDLYLSFRGVGDVQKINTFGKQTIGAGGSNYAVEYRDRWTPTNPSNTIPRAIDSDPSGNNRISDRFVEDAGFFRFQSFQVGYSFRGAVLNRMGLDNLRCYVSGSNLFVITPYSGLDPENFTTPTAFTFGANLSF